MSLLDDVKAIEAIDKRGMRKFQADFPLMCEDAILRAEKVKVRFKKPNAIIVAGMGGSSIAGELLRDWLSNDIQVPIEVVRDYYLPAYVNEDSLVFASSYSGDTEETLSCFIEAVKRGSIIIAISSGGRLIEYCRRLKIPFIDVPKGIPPRAALPYLFFPIVIILEKARLIEKKRDEIKETMNVLNRLKEEVGLESPSSKNRAKRMAIELKGTIPVIYGFRHYRSVALRMKTQFNENSKVPAKCEVFPELDHNEIVGWEGSEEITKKFSVILLRDEEESLEMKVRISLTRDLILEKKARKVFELYGRGKSKLAKMLSALYFGDHVSFYLAILNGVDPMPVKTISRLKSEAEKRVKIVERLDKIVESLATLSHR